MQLLGQNELYQHINMHHLSLFFLTLVLTFFLLLSLLLSLFCSCLLAPSLTTLPINGLILQKSKMKTITLLYYLNYKQRSHIYNIFFLRIQTSSWQFFFSVNSMRFSTGVMAQHFFSTTQIRDIFGDSFNQISDCPRKSRKSGHSILLAIAACSFST